MEKNMDVEKMSIEKEKGNNKNKKVGNKMEKKGFGMYKDMKLEEKRISEEWKMEKENVKSEMIKDEI